MGAVATVAMSVPMLLARRLRIIDRQPPEEITDRVLDEADLPTRGSRLRMLTAWNHLWFGALAGIVFVTLRGASPSVARFRALGPAYGLTIWFAAYRLVLPRVGLIRRESQAGRARDAVMLVAHLVYGLVLERLTR